MDRFIAEYQAEADGDLALCIAEGVAYQADRTNLIVYDEAYYAKCASYDETRIAEAINAARVDLVARYFGPGRIVDVGIGSGEFIRSRPNTWGHDVNPVGIEWLKRNDLWASRLSTFGAACFWDVLEHVEEPEQYLRQIQLHAWAFVSLPIFEDLRRIRESRHYRPGEHLYYWTHAGFVDWMSRHGFLLCEANGREIDAGREAIYSFAFKRNRWAR